MPLSRKKNKLSEEFLEKVSSERFFDMPLLSGNNFILTDGEGQVNTRIFFEGWGEDEEVIVTVAAHNMEDKVTLNGKPCLSKRTLGIEGKPEANACPSSARTDARPGGTEL